MNKQFEKKAITKKSINFSEWYNDVVLQAELADYSPVKGCMVIRPYGYALWENIQKNLDQAIKAAGVENAYFPLFIPISYLEKEKEHVKGFSPELAVVTIGGGEELAEKLVIRPTSETVIYSMFAKWIQSWRDLPLKVNQWCNIVRWEKRTYLFLRTTEFLWQEGHTVHATHEEAKQEVQRALTMYRDIFEQYLAMPGIVGKKSPFDKFPGAVDTLAFESLMPDGKALQSGTSHDLGQNFAKAFGVKFQDEKGVLEYGWQTCWGFSTRTIGGLIMLHGDDQGLVLPPEIAPIQVVIIPIYKSDNNHQVLQKANQLKEQLQKEFRVKLDNRPGYSLGYKINDWELKGVPLRIEIGEKEILNAQFKVVKRLTRGAQRELYLSSNEELNLKIDKLLKELQNDLYIRAKELLTKRTYIIDSWQEFKTIMFDKNKKGFLKAFWCEKQECEQQIKKETKASTRCLPLDAREESGRCVYCGKPAKHRWIFAQAY